MFSGDLRIGRLAGIPISIHPLWLLIVGLITWSLGSAYYPDEVSGIAPIAAYALGLASALLLFGSILLHELGHAVVARRYGVQIEGIELWLLGGVAKMKGAAHRPQDELRFALAGPAVTLLIAIVFWAAAALTRSAADALVALLAYQALINTAILVFNMLPAFPLDGGRVLRAILWERSGDIEQATARAARVGRGFGYGMVALGFFGVLAGAPGLLWLTLIGFFLVIAGRAEETGIELQSTFRGLGLRRTMAVPAATLDADTTVAEALRDSFAPLGYHAFPVLEAGHPIGLLNLQQIGLVPSDERDSCLVGELADRDPSLFVDEDVTVEELVSRRGFRRHNRAIVVCRDGRVGLISATAMSRALEARRMLGESAQTAQASEAA
ncbi:MAG TPA: site-2 protease family protein [Solirubrobacterales bacterium]|nr:site-2 protease family protein [Solirubrobacterales bacterium]